MCQIRAFRYFGPDSEAIVCGDEEPDEEAGQIHLRDWDEAPPEGEGWTLAWRGQNDDGDANIVWWRPRQGDVATHKILRY